MHTSVHSIGLTSLIRMPGGNSSPPFLDRYHVEASSKRRREIAGNAIQLARRVEMESIALRLVIPLSKEKFESMNMRDRVLVTSKIVGLPRNRRYDSAIEHMLQFMPTLAAEVEVNAISGMDPTRRDSHNDFFDRELLIYAMAHRSDERSVVKACVSTSRSRWSP